ncbi:DKNYY domain-containing protein [Wohlfahrtiimonas larvae]|uniref:DKNYY family protein n=1 Tax=Wohlfahrtiimonas larvae TaxID=1157986 RepID=A0ABP9MAQ9_9GAMM|nr:DKNYY domain-containing protein [Wohlfahrtiimonas larvae]
MQIKKLLLNASSVLTIVGIGLYLFIANQAPTIYYPWQGFYYKSIDEYADAFDLPKDKIDTETFTLLSDGLAHDKNNIYYFQKIIPNTGIDTIEEYKHKLFLDFSRAYHGPEKDQWDEATFQILDVYDAIARDKNHSYFGGYILKSIPRDQLQALSNGFYTDNTDVYHGSTKTKLNIKHLKFDHGYAIDNQTIMTQSIFGLRSYLDADAKTFKAINRNFAKDKNHYFYQGAELANIDYASFKPFIRHAVDKNRAYFFLNPGQINITNGTDLASYEELNRYYAKDKNYLYTEGKRVANVDPNKIQKNQFGTLHDGTNVISGTGVIMNADVETFRRYPDMGYATDKNSIYYNDQKILGSDGQSFEFITTTEYGRAYVKDKNYIYKNGRMIEGLDPDTFEIISDDWFKDKDHIFYREDIVNEADYETFEVINESMARDKNNLYFVFAFSYSVVQSIKDPLSFEHVDGRFFKDKFKVYYSHVSEFYPLNGVDVESFEVLGDGYFKDKNKIYYKEHTSFYRPPFITKADSQTFSLVKPIIGASSHFDGRDKNGCFKEGSSIDCSK